MKSSSTICNKYPAARCIGSGRFRLVALIVAQLFTSSAKADLIVASFGNSRILRYNETTGTYLGNIAQISSFGHLNPEAVALDANGTMYVSAFNSNSVTKFDVATGTYHGVFAQESRIAFPREIRIHGGLLYVTSRGNDDVSRYNLATGQFIDRFASGGGLDSPTGITFGPNGDLFVSSFVTDEVIRYDGVTGQLVGTFATGGGLDGPWGLTFGPDGSLYVGSHNTASVLRYNGVSGAFMGVVASLGLPAGEMGVKFAPDGKLFVSHSIGNVIRRYNVANGQLIDNFISGSPLNGPIFFTFTSEAVPEPAGLTAALLLSLGVVVRCARHARYPREIKGDSPGHRKSKNGSRFLRPFNGRVNGQPREVATLPCLLLSECRTMNDKSHHRGSRQ